MNTKKRNLIFILLIFTVWAGVSAYHYTCNLKGFCSKEVVESVNEDNDYQEDYKYDEFDINEKDFSKTFNLNNKIEEKENEIVGQIAMEKKTFVENKEVIKCYTYINANLKYGSQNNYGEEVKKLKKFLNEYFDSNLDENLSFDLETKELVEKFQMKNNLEVDGIVGPETLKIINAIHCVRTNK